MRTKSILESRRPGDELCVRERRTIWVTSAHYECYSDSSVWGGQGFELGWRKAAMERMHRWALRLHGEYLFGFSTDRPRRCRHRGNPYIENSVT